jgi:hypothetical protein
MNPVANHWMSKVPISSTLSLQFSPLCREEII